MSFFKRKTQGFAADIERLLNEKEATIQKACDTIEKLEKSKEASLDEAFKMALQFRTQRDELEQRLARTEELLAEWEKWGRSLRWLCHLQNKSIMLPEQTVPPMPERRELNEPSDAVLEMQKKVRAQIGEWPSDLCGDDLNGGR